jgi:hypothetical protein
VEWLRLVGARPMLGKRFDPIVGVDLNVVAWQRGLTTMMFELGDVDLATSEVCMGPWRLDISHCEFV